MSRDNTEALGASTLLKSTLPDQQILEFLYNKLNKNIHAFEGQQRRIPQTPSPAHCPTSLYGWLCTAGDLVMKLSLGRERARHRLLVRMGVDNGTEA